jgi:AcrR family transcriptional regulator
LQKPRRSFNRESPEQRREDLIHATLEVIGEGGAKAATVRNIAAHANVTLGLIRYYFSTKEELINAAYEVYLTNMIDLSMAADHDDSLPARVRLHDVIMANFSDLVLRPQSMALWAAFIEMTGQIPEMAEIHARIYKEERRRFQALIQEVLVEAGKTTATDLCRDMAVASNAVINGLWIEAVRLPPSADQAAPSPIALKAISAIVGVDLLV